MLQAADFGVPQLRPRFVLVALKPADSEHFSWPLAWGSKTTGGGVLLDLMAENGWGGAERWAARANGIAPTIVGGSTKHGGPDLGPTRAKRQWRTLGVDGMGIADRAPDASFPEDGLPRLTIRMVARLQNFPDTWEFTGGKTAAYRQVGNAFPPTVARAVGIAIRAAMQRKAVQGAATLLSPTEQHAARRRGADKTRWATGVSPLPAARRAFRLGLPPPHPVPPESGRET